MTHEAGIDQFWCANKWWLKEEYAMVWMERITASEMECYVDEIARVFNETWCRTTKPHPAQYWLGSQGLMPMQWLCSVGHDLASIRDSRGYGAVVHDLRDPGKFESARLGLAVAAALATAGHAVAFEPSVDGGKRADVLSTYANEKVFIEIKVLRESESSGAMSYFATILGMSIREVIQALGGELAKLNSIIELSPELEFGAGPDVDKAVIHGLVESVGVQVSEKLREGERAFTLAHIGSFRFGSPIEIPQSTLSYRSSNATEELTRVMRSCIYKGVGQLSRACPGLIIVRTQGELSSSQTMTILGGYLKGLGKGASHLSAVIFLPMYYSLPSRWSLFEPFAVRNTAATVAPESLRAFSAIADAFGVSFS